MQTGSYHNPAAVLTIIAVQRQKRVTAVLNLGTYAFLPLDGNSLYVYGSIPSCRAKQGRRGAGPHTPGASLDAASLDSLLPHSAFASRPAAVTALSYLMLSRLSQALSRSVRLGPAEGGANRI